MISFHLPTEIHEMPSEPRPHYRLITPELKGGRTNVVTLSRNQEEPNQALCNENTPNKLMHIEK